jgi:Asp-tRNA(Asn)/Glu-tRNA(Gln) amidotransferase A subunit family amidase
MIPTNFLTATGTPNALRDGATTVTQIVNDHQARFEARDQDVHAWVVTQHAAVVKPGDKDQRYEEGQADLKLLHGVTVGVKDIFSEFAIGTTTDRTLTCTATKDMPTRYGSRIYEDDEQGGHDASVVALCREQGALILGKTVRYLTFTFAHTPR